MKSILVCSSDVITSPWPFLPIQIDYVSTFQLLNEDKIDAMDTQNVIQYLKNLPRITVSNNCSCNVQFYI